MNFQAEWDGELFPWRVLVAGSLSTSWPGITCDPLIINFCLAAHLLLGLTTGNLIPGCSQKISGNGILETHL